MSFLTEVEITIGFTLLLMLICVPVVRSLAVRIGLVDKPNHRKVHQTPVPLVGGISVGISVTIACSVSELFASALWTNLPWIAGSITMLVIGVLDDRFNISAGLRLVIQFACAFAVAYSGIRITSLYGIFGIYELPLAIQYALTVITIAGVVNAINLMDGIDGLLGGLALVASSILGVLSFEEGLYDLTVFFSAIIGALIGFLRFNLSKKKIFMGDAGSLALGFTLVVAALRILNATSSQPVYDQLRILLFIAGIFLVPVLDSLRVYRGRIKKGSSPFNADKTHLHHLFLFTGVTHKKATLLILALVMIIIAIVGGLIYLVPTTWVILSAVIVFVFVSGFLTLRHSVNEWADRIRKIERAE